jgi:hypothetical protein
MEGFIRLVIGGGLALVAGLWLAELSGTLAGPAARWSLVAGGVLALAGAVALGAGVGAEVEWRG